MEKSMCRASPIPTGYHFLPTDEELLLEFLKPKLKKGATFPEPCPVLDAYVYEKEPWYLFPHITPNKSVYVFSELTPSSTRSSSKRIKRGAGCGTWKLECTNNVNAKSKNKNKGELIGYKKLLTFEMDNTQDKKRKKNDQEYGSWIMHEFSLVGFPRFAICQIRYKPSKEEEAIKRSRQGSSDDPPPPVGLGLGLGASMFEEEQGSVLESLKSMSTEECLQFLDGRVPSYPSTEDQIFASSPVTACSPDTQIASQALQSMEEAIKNMSPQQFRDYLTQGFAFNPYGPYETFLTFHHL